VDTVYSHFTTEPTVAAATYAALGVDKAIEAHIAAYPNLKYIVLAGSDSVIPQFRFYDEALIANESEYDSGALTDSAMQRAHRQFYYLADAPYATAGSEMGFMAGKYLYLPDYALGRLVESPAEMLAATNAFLAGGTLQLEKGLVVGYDFLNDLAGREMVWGLDRGLSMTPLIGDVWTADDLEARLFTTPGAPDLANINGHFSHYENIAADTGSGTTTALEVQAASSSFLGGLYASVGCHAGFNMPDGQAQAGKQTDFAQVFVSRGAVWVAASAFAYGDSDLVAYSELLNLKLLQALQDGGTVGEAFNTAKRQYFQDAAALSIYDEKVLHTYSLYGFPMARVDLPDSGSATATPPQSIASPAGAPAGLSSQVITTTPSLSLSTTANGSYYQAGGGGVAVIAGAPVQPQVVVTGLNRTGEVLHGVLWLGGAFTETTGFDPVIAGLAGNNQTLASEPNFAMSGWVPSTPGGMLSRLGDDERLISIPAQYNADLDIQRLYDEVLYQSYHAPESETDFTAPRILSVVNADLTLATWAEDDSGIARVVALWRERGEYRWHLLELSAGAGVWRGEIPYSGSADVLYLVQALDGAGNVSLVDDGGVEFVIGQSVSGGGVYLPLIIK